jgi:hypothetical protein
MGLLMLRSRRFYTERGGFKKTIAPAASLRGLLAILRDPGHEMTTYDLPEAPCKEPVAGPVPIS